MAETVADNLRKSLANQSAHTYSEPPADGASRERSRRKQFLKQGVRS